MARLEGRLQGRALKFFWNFAATKPRTAADPAQPRPFGITWFKDSQPGTGGGLPQSLEVRAENEDGGPMSRRFLGRCLARATAATLPAPRAEYRRSSGRDRPTRDWKAAPARSRCGYSAATGCNGF